MTWYVPESCTDYYSHPPPSRQDEVSHPSAPPLQSRQHDAMNGAAFWAQKRDVIKSADCHSSPSITKSSKLGQTPSKKQGFIVNGAAGDFTNPSVAMEKKADWADSDEDEEFLAAFSAKRSDLRLISLESEMFQKDTRIEELETVVLVRDMRIDELEHMVQEKDDRISDLEVYAEEHAERVEQLSKENHEQYLHVQELVAEVDEKDRRIDKLEKALDEKAAIIRSLEVESDSQTQVSTEHADVEQAKKIEPIRVKARKAKGTIDESSDDEAVPNVILSDTSTASTTDYPSENGISQPKGAEKTTIESVQEDTTGPSFRESDFPIFVTRETLKIVPPAPMPKKMSFPIDFSKYGRKVSPTSAVMQPNSMKGKHNPISASGLKFKYTHAKTDTVPDFDPCMDIRQMDLAQRVLYANGQKVIVKMGEIRLATLPKYVLMQCSGKAKKYFTENPNATSIIFPADSMNLEAAKAHLVWMNEMTYQSRVYSITLNVDQKFDAKNLKICRAARVLGLNNTYVGHFTKQFCDRIRHNEASVEVMNMICDLAYPENDPIFDCLAYHLFNQRMRKTLKMSDELAILLANHAVLKTKMESMEKGVQNGCKVCFNLPLLS